MTHPDPRARVNRDAHNRMHRNVPSPAPRSSPRIVPGPTCATSEFQKALQQAFDEGTVLQLNNDVVVDTSVDIRITQSHQGWFGLDGNMHKIVSTVEAGPVIRVFMDAETPAGTCSRGMFFGNFSLLGCGHEEGGLVFIVPANDRWLVNPEWRSIWIEGTGGFAWIAIEGSIFEGNLYSVGTMNCQEHGAYFNHAGPSNNLGVVSALRWYGGTHRQNGGDGILVNEYNGPYDVRLYGLYFC